LDLLRFSPLLPHERLRLGATTLALRHLGNPAELDDRTTADWLSSLFGRRIWENFWQPLFFAKFGDRAATLPALYIWQRLGREGNTSDRGYLRGGLKHLIDTTEAEIERRGGRILKSATAIRLEPEGDVAGPLRLTYEHEGTHHTSTLDWALSTVPMPSLARITQNTALQPWVGVPDLPYQGVVNGLFFLNRPLGGHYWLPVVQSGTEFDGVVEMTTLIDRASLNGAHLAYVMKYGDRSDPLFGESDEAIAERWTEQFLQIYKPLHLRRSDIRDVRIFRAPFVEPAYPLGYSRKKPDFSVGPSRLVLATSAQVYPHITSWNSAVRLCEQSLVHLYRRAGRPTPQPFALQQAA
jgi:protoporphyrinogen oxidase